MRLFSSILAVATLWPLGGAQARADVLEIGGQGDVLVRSGAADVRWSSAAPASTPPLSAPGAAMPGASMADTGSVIPATWRAPIETAAARYRLSPELLAALVWQESRWRPAAISPRGAMGLAQLMPSTARDMAVDARDPVANLDGGAHYLRRMLDLFDGDIERALAAYNAGPARVLRAGGVPAIAETRAYVANIMDRLTSITTAGLFR